MVDLGCGVGLFGLFVNGSCVSGEVPLLAVLSFQVRFTLDHKKGLIRRGIERRVLRQLALPIYSDG